MALFCCFIFSTTTLQMFGTCNRLQQCYYKNNQSGLGLIKVSELVSRQKMLLKKLIVSKKYRSVGSFAKELEVSSRTLHNDLKAIDRFLEAFSSKVTKKSGVGIKLVGEDNEKLLYDLENEEIRKESVEGRRQEILLSLLYNETATSYRKLAEKYFVSISSITNDLVCIKEWLALFNLSLVKSNVGTEIKGNEEDIRTALCSLFKDGIMKHNDETAVEVLDVKESQCIIQYIEEELGYKFNEEYYEHLTRIVTVMLSRISNGFTVTSSEDLRLEEFHALRTYGVVQKALHLFSSLSITEIPQSEIQYLNSSILGARLSHVGTNVELYYQDILKKLVAELCTMANEAFETNIHDETLYNGLLIHLKPMLYRLKHGLIVQNPLLDDIKENYSAMFGFTWFLGSFIEKETGLKLNDHEVSFLMIHFQAALERNVSIKKVIVVCPGGVGTSQLIANRIKRMVPQIYVTAIYSYRELLDVNVEALDIDFIISTIPLQDINKKVVLVSPMMDVNDAKKLNSFYLDYIFQNENQIRHRHEKLLHAIDRNLIFTNLDMTSKDEVIEFVSASLQKRGYVTDQFYESVKNREQKASTDLGNKVAIPHGENQFVQKSCISVVTLKEPIRWGRSEVSIVFFIVLKVENKQSMRPILRELYQVLDSKRILQMMERASCEDDILHILGGKEDD
jgi:activator of the mannose operon (transcriptional antiterminator)